MRILIVGAGATGGYFGGRLAQAGRDVTFLVRPRRARQLADDGLRIHSPQGDVHLPEPQTVLAERIVAPFDLIVLSCKAYDLDGAIAAFAPAVGPQTLVLPILNGLRHYDTLDARFGRAAIIDGYCSVVATLDEAGAIRHMNPLHILAFGERDGAITPRVERIAAQLSNAGFEARASSTIRHDAWEKWTFLAALAAGTCLMRATVGDILAAPGGQRLLLALHAECSAIAAANGHAPRAEASARDHHRLSEAASTLTASMLRDIERGGRIEADQIIGDLIARRPATTAEGLLDIVYTHLKAYQARQSR